MHFNCLWNIIVNIVFFPFILLWDIIVTALIVSAFVAWFGFLFGSVIAVVLVLIFAPDLFLLPMAIGVLYVPFFEYRGECEEEPLVIDKKEKPKGMIETKREIEEALKLYKEVEKQIKKGKK